LIYLFFLEKFDANSMYLKKCNLKNGISLKMRILYYVMKNTLEALNVKTVVQGNLLLNMDKKKIMDPAILTLSGKSSIEDIAFVHPQWGNPFQYELFRLLMDEWKGDKITLIKDSQEMRDFLVKQDDYEFHRDYKQRLRREVRKENGIHIISFDQKEVDRLRKTWERFINQFVLINYDSHLFMTIDRRLFKRTKSLMPYFFLAQAEERDESNGSWSGDRIGIEPIGTSTFDSMDYFEMFRMIGDKSACQLGVEDIERRYGLKN